MPGRYRTIVVDPPWPMPATGKTTRGETDSRGIYTAKSGRQIDGNWWGRHRGGSVELPYETMPLDKIAALPVGDLAEKAAHLYVWTTNRFLEETFGILRGWGFPHKPVTLTWGKPPMGKGFGGAFTSTSEFVLFARRGGLPHLEKQDSTWWAWSRVYRNGHIDHSAKPPVFLDLVEQVSPGPRLEMFARSQRLGWDTWGNEALEHVSLPLVEGVGHGAQRWAATDGLAAGETPAPSTSGPLSERGQCGAGVAQLVERPAVRMGEVAGSIPVPGPVPASPGTPLSLSGPLTEGDESLSALASEPATGSPSVSGTRRPQ